MVRVLAPVHGLESLACTREPMCSILTLAGALLPQSIWPSFTVRVRHTDTRVVSCVTDLKPVPAQGLFLHLLATCPGDGAAQGSLPGHKCHWKWVGSHLSEEGTFSFTHLSWLSLLYRSQIPMCLPWVCFVFLLSKYTSVLGQTVDVLCVVRPSSWSACA